MKNGLFEISIKTPEIRIELSQDILDYIVENLVLGLSKYAQKTDTNSAESKETSPPPTTEPIEAQGDPTEGESPSFASKEEFIHYAHLQLSKFRDNDIDDNLIKSVITDLGYDNLYDVPTGLREAFKNKIDSILDKQAKEKNAADQ